MKLSTQLTIIVCVGLVGMFGMVAFLATAGWSEGGIAGMVTGIGSMIGSLIVVARSQQKTQEALGEIQEKTDTVVTNTNGRLTALGDRILELEDQVRSLGGQP